MSPYHIMDTILVYKISDGGSDRSGQLTEFRFVYIPTQTTESKYFLFIKLSLFLSTAVMSSSCPVNKLFTEKF